MAQFQKRVRKNGKPSYTATVRIKGRESVTSTFDSLTKARLWANKIETDIRDNMKFPHKKAQKMTMNEIIDRYIAHELNKKTPKMQHEFLTALNWYKKEIGHLYLAGVTPAVLIECREKLAKKKKIIPIRDTESKGLTPRMSDETISPATVNRYMTYMRVVFSYCVNDLDIIDLNPMAKVKKLSEKNERKRYLEQKEIVKLLNACQQRSYELYLCVLIALLTGARKSEIIKLTWATVDLENKMFYFLDTKNGTDRGTPMHEYIFNELVKYKNQNKVRSLNNDYVFKTEDGKPKESLIGKLFPKVVKQCGIKDFRFHDLRHTGASWQAMNGISQPITQKILGHKSPAMTNRYSHLRDDSLRPAINQVGDKILAGWLKAQ